ncbi:zinc finger MYM-type protein 1-like [Capsicum annuum]|uniref:zinc finger MYM-type protein 1-like n=1 Tax=Capsicum annuum TaxID=4072 RepID=UPI001FB0E62A|nr:zinc finger MYM-type protein 1-like [Capsicum annuum]
MEESQRLVKNFFTVVPKSNLVSHIDIQCKQESNANHSKVALPSQENAEEFDLNSLKFDLGERIPILKYPSKHRDLIRRAYLLNGPCQPRLQLHEYPQTDISGSMRRFNHEWFDDVYHDWLEYSDLEVETKRSLEKHIGLPNSVHNQLKKKCQDLLRQKQSIQYEFDKQLNQLKHGYWIRINALVDVARLLITQGFAFRGHDESKTSLSRGKFLQILSWYAKKCDKIHAYVLERAPQNDQMISPSIQKDIVSACKIETVKAILEELNGGYFSLLVDESFDVSHKEKMDIILRYVDRMGFVMERLIDIVHVQDTSALSLKKTIANLLAQYSLSLSSVCGQYYDGASNMQGEIDGLNMLIRQESRSAHSIHCVAHQLQLTLVGVSKKCIEVGKLIVSVSNILNMLGSSFKRMDELRDSQKHKIQEALDMGKITIGSGLNQ